MISEFFKTVVVTSVLSASAAMAADCVDGTDQMVSVVEGGKTYQAPIIESYMALIEKRDLVNSKGVRLGSFAAVMQQDRANLHKSGVADRDGDFHDTVDKYFTSPKRRGQLATAKYFMGCYMTSNGIKTLKADIVNGRTAGVLWVVAFRRANGAMGVYLSEVN